MAKVISSADADALSGDLRYWAYNSLDCVVTHEVAAQLRTRLDARDHNSTNSAKHARLSYSFVRAMQGPALAMMRRGVMIDQMARMEQLERLERESAEAQALLDRLANEVWGPRVEIERRKREVFVERIGKRGQALKPQRRVEYDEIAHLVPRGLNVGSPKQKLEFFNKALGMPEHYELRKTLYGVERTLSAGKKALKRWEGVRAKGPGVNTRDRSVSWVHFAKPFCILVNAIQEANARIRFLRTPLDPDGRMRCTYQVAGTETGRWSSQKNVFGRGGNLQNVTPLMRRMFCADEGYWFISTDYEQAESRMVAALAWAAGGAGAYWSACEGSDLHTQVCRMSWPELAWSGEDKEDRVLADRPYPDYPNLSYRDFAKRLGHGSNYRGSAGGISAATGVPASLVSPFQERYFAAFPEIRLWHQAIITELQSTGRLITPLGRLRWFFGRLDDDATIREAIAFKPQSTIGEMLNESMRRVWMRSTLREEDPSRLPLELLLQNHDAFAFQVRGDLSHATLSAQVAPSSHPVEFILNEVRKELEIPLDFRRVEPQGEASTRRLVIPAEFVIGFNWAYADDPSRPRSEWRFPDSNPDGLKKWKGPTSLERRRTSPARASAAAWLARGVA